MIRQEGPLLVCVGLAAGAGTIAPDGATGAGAALVGAIFGVGSAGLGPVTAAPGRAARLVWPLLASASALLGIGLGLALAGFWMAPGQLGLLGVGMLCFVMLLRAVARGAVALGVPAPVATTGSVGLFLLACAAPLWLAPALTGIATDAVDAVVALSPPSHLAGLMGVDYLRGDWLYRHSPLGGLRFDYPPAGHTLLLGAVAAVALVIPTATPRPGRAI